MYCHELPSYLIQDAKIPQKGFQGRMVLPQIKLLDKTSEGKTRYSKDMLNKLDRKEEKSLSEDKFQSGSRSTLIKGL